MLTYDYKTNAGTLEFSLDLFFESIQGQTSTNAAQLVTILNHFIPNSNSSDVFFESGTYYGKSAAIFLQLENIKEAILVDQADYLLVDKISNYYTDKKVTFFKERSEVFLETQLSKAIGNKTFRWAHLDASHYFSNVTTELQLLSKYMHSEGLICLDDWSDVYSQVRAAYYFLSYTDHDFDWELFATGFNKAILCRKHMFNYWNNKLIEIFSEKEHHFNSIDVHWRISRTNFDQYARNFHISLRKESDDSFYGKNVWGDRFYQLI